jgi:hypothetical protein
MICMETDHQELGTPEVMINLQLVQVLMPYQVMHERRRYFEYMHSRMMRENK